MAVTELSQSAARARNEPEAETSAAPEIEEVEYAFVVYRTLDGRLVTTNDIDKPIAPKRAPTHDELYGTLQVLIKDVIGQQYAAMNAQAVLQVQQAMMQQMMGEQQMGTIAEELAKERRR